ncbi:MAG: pirin family protein [Methylobacterium sp.]|nr:pirin family protein [Methylobacterium sp.]
MITLRPAAARGQADHGWLQARHSFSFGGYHDPANMGYSVLRVINEDIIAPGMGFGMHAHRDMEIVTYLLAGALRHQDSLGHGAEIHAGEIQVMSAGSGVRHSEFNASLSVPAHLLQIWIQPAEPGLPPHYAQREIARTCKHGRWCVLASGDGREDAIRIHQDAAILATVLQSGDAPLSFAARAGRRYYLQLAAGEVRLNGIPMRAGDGACIENETQLTLSDAREAEALLFDLP